MVIGKSLSQSPIMNHLQKTVYYAMQKQLSLATWVKYQITN
ncbi:MAG: hypothetical protein ACKPEO_24650 [Sphaerospermopsis kisseleviana]